MLPSYGFIGTTAERSQPWIYGPTFLLYAFQNGWRRFGLLASLEDIFLALGRVQEGVEQLREDFQEEKRNAHESRTTIHHRLDLQAAEIASLKTDVAIHGKIEAQVRNEVQSLGEQVKANQDAVQPSVDDWKRMKALGIGIAGLLALGGLSFGAFLGYASDAAVTAIRHWLRIT